MTRQGSSEDRDRWWREAEPQRRGPGREEEYDPEYEHFRSAEYAEERGWEPESREERQYGRERQYDEEQRYGRRGLEQSYEAQARRGYEIRPSREEVPERGYRGDYQRPRQGYSGAGQAARYGWTVQGPHTGKGPRGYRRSDERIREDVSERLMQDGRIDASNMEVNVRNGVVTLTGTVDSRQTKRLAEEVVETVPGVTDVQVQLGTRGSGWEPAGRESRAGQQQLRFEGPDSGADYRQRVRAGMEVVDTNGNRVGQVKEVRDNEFLLDRTMARDIYIQFSALGKVDDRIWLNIMESQIDQTDWPRPELKL